MKPTDEELNKAMAEACGWTRIEPCEYIKGVMHYAGISPDGRMWHGLPQYCTDRNALLEVWEAVEKAGRCYRFTVEVENAACELAATPVRINIFDRSEHWHLAKLPPRLHVIAALKALDKWPEEWEA